MNNHLPSQAPLLYLARVLWAKESKLSQTIPVSWGLDSLIKVNKTHWPLHNQPFLCNSMWVIFPVKKLLKEKEGRNQEDEEATEIGGADYTPT